MARRTVAREAGASQYHEGPIKTRPKTPRTWRQYGTEGLTWEPQSGHHSSEAQTADDNISSPVEIRPTSSIYRPIQQHWREHKTPLDLLPSTGEITKLR